jgi:multidrug efflux pump subunit AcrA (membrane-fusion protein)
MSTEQPVDPQAIEGAKRQIRGLVDEIAQLSKQDLDPQIYYGEFLQRVVTALAAVGGAVWTLTPDRRLRLDFQINLRETSLAEPGEDQRRHTRLLSRIMENNDPLLVAPYSGTSGDDEAGNPTSFLLVLAPIVSEDEVEGVVEIFQRPGSEPVAQRGFLRFVAQMAELAGQWLKSRKLKHYGDQKSLWMRADEFARRVHESLDARLTAYTIANEGRRIIGCDRVSVAIRRGNKYRIEAVSGQDTFDRRSNTVVLLGRLATTIVATGEPLWYSGITDDLPPQIEEAVQDYVDESHTKAIAVLPLNKPVEQREKEAEEVDREEVGEVVGALVIEQIEDTRPKEAFSQRVDLVREHGARALANAVDHNSVFLMPVWRTIGKARWLVQAKRLPKTVTITAAIVIALLAAFLVPRPFNLKGEGELQPVKRRDVFAAAEGRVDKVMVKHGELVNEGDELIVLESLDLDAQLEGIAGDRQVAREKLRTAENIIIRVGNQLRPEERSQLFGDVRQYKQELLNLSRQYDLLQEKKQQLTIRSPIAGRVISWKNERKLRYRPVMPGQKLMTIADPTGEWELEVFMPEKRMGHVARALQKLEDENKKTGQDDKLAVSYVLRTDPKTSLEGEVRDIHDATEVRDEKGQSVRIRVEIEEKDLTDPRAGATATARVHCGYRSFAYVWLHEAIEWIQANVLF